MEKCTNMDQTTNILQTGIFIMTKFPEVGKVKARLAKSIGNKFATGLYRSFIQDTLTTVHTLDIPFHIAVFPPESQERFAKWLGHSYQFFHQQGSDLGERLQNSFSAMFEKGYQRVIALASDSPDIPKEILETAVSGLQTHKVVIGPTTDGGYYLIGFLRDLFIPRAFEKITWSTETVFQETLSKIESITKEVLVLPLWNDIDHKSDLQEFYETYQQQPSVNLHTMNYLRSHSELLQILQR
jgi:rSAM/selenodomain-associated transferase 1